MATVNNNHIPRRIIQSFEGKSLKKRSFILRIADSLTGFFGTMFFLIFNLVLFFGWILINTGKIDRITAIDPFPFPLLTTIVSLEAIFLTIIVLMSQNRQNQTSTIRDELQLQVILIAEKEITKILKLVRLILRKQGVEIKNDIELEAMIDEIDASYIERKLEEEIVPNTKK
ncbi:MAG: DUF1003 domain-containing protein [Patescibacteria group bacterium]